MLMTRVSLFFYGGMVRPKKYSWYSDAVLYVLCILTLQWIYSL